jgi:sugar phosphate isomerase/epimerase
MFLDALDGHSRCNINYDPSHFVLMALDYIAFIDLYHDRIKAFHVKDAEFNPDGRQGVYSGFQPWLKRAGRFRSLGDGQVDFGAVFSKLAEYDYDSWAVLEWECALKHPRTGPRKVPRSLPITSSGLRRRHSTTSPAGAPTGSRRGGYWG